MNRIPPHTLVNTHTHAHTYAQMHGCPDTQKHTCMDIVHACTQITTRNNTNTHKHTHTHTSVSALRLINAAAVAAAADSRQCAHVDLWLQVGYGMLHVQACVSTQKFLVTTILSSNHTTDAVRARHLRLYAHNRGVKMRYNVNPTF